MHSPVLPFCSLDARHPAMSEPRSIRDRFPAPWRVDEMPAGFRVVDASATPLAYVYALSEQQRAALPGRTLTQAEARAIAAAIASLSLPT